MNFENAVEINKNYTTFRELYMYFKDWEELYPIKSLITNIISDFILDLKQDIKKIDNSIEMKCPMPIFNTQNDIDLIWTNGDKEIKVNFLQYPVIHKNDCRYDVKISCDSKDCSFSCNVIDFWPYKTPYTDEFFNEIMNILKKRKN